MADLRTMLAQILGQQEAEPANLNPSAPSTRPGTRGIFGRRPMGQPYTGMNDIAPAQPSWAQGVRPYRDIQPPQEQSFAMGPGAYMGAAEPQIAPQPMPRAARINISAPDSPGSFGNFADYANTSLGLRTALEPMDREPWRSPVQTERMRVGDVARVGGFEPPSAPQQDQASLEDEAWNAALSRVQDTIRIENQHQARGLPRPGQPLIAQAWAGNPQAGGLIGGLVGSQGRTRPNPLPRTGRR